MSDESWYIFSKKSLVSTRGRLLTSRALWRSLSLCLSASTAIDSMKPISFSCDKMPTSTLNKIWIETKIAQSGFDTVTKKYFLEKETLTNIPRIEKPKDVQILVRSDRFAASWALNYQFTTFEPCQLNWFDSVMTSK